VSNPGKSLIVPSEQSRTEEKAALYFASLDESGWRSQAGWLEARHFIFGSFTFGDTIAVGRVEQRHCTSAKRTQWPAPPSCFVAVARLAWRTSPSSQITS